ncbi:MFS transporter [Piscirickettsia salmonis]|uniref:MFS transporter n=1 Tax=Piscirickettsia salmonis TaxID=1238 RepID=UPI0007C8F9F6|nr:Tetracycline resistance protein, class B [Piscirickettsiaceae bacterium NZ-RLO1]
MMKKSTLFSIILCHFIAASATLGIAPFFSIILDKNFQLSHSPLVGFLYVLPTLLTAIASPFWGKIADKINKKSALLRAQLGLSISFLIAAFSSGCLSLFILSLCLQGLLGGTLAAANAYLATTSHRQQLSQLLNLTQFSARAAFLIAPILIGFLINSFSPLNVYFLLALITFISAIIIYFSVPKDENKNKNFGHNKITPNSKPKLIDPAINILPYYCLLTASFVFNFSTVISFPYFITLLQAHFNIHSGLILGLLFGLPHAVYLISIFSLQKYRQQPSQQPWIFTGALILLAFSLYWQCITTGFFTLIILRIVMGAAITLGFISLNRMIATLKLQQQEGKVFGWLDSISKWAGVCAGLAAGFSYQFLGITAPFIISSFILLIAAFSLIIYLCKRQYTVTRSYHA